MNNVGKAIRDGVRAGVDAVDKDDALSTETEEQPKSGTVPPALPESNQPDAPKEAPEEKTAPTVPMSKKDDPAMQKMLADFVKPGDAADEALLKPVGKWTEDESRAVMKKRFSMASSDPQHAALVKREKEYFNTHYGTAPVKRDETGKALPAQLKAPLPTTPSPVSTPDGASLEDAVATVGDHLVNQADKHSLPVAVKGLQAGLNLLRNPGASARLKTDGIAGPKTVRAARTATAHLGAPKVKEAAAVGTFADATSNRTLASNPDSLKKAVDDSIAPLFGEKKPSQSNLWGKGFQAAVNDTGADVMGSAFKPIKEDGWIGPKTADAFDTMVSRAAPMDFAGRFAKGLGFL